MGEALMRTVRRLGTPAVRRLVTPVLLVGLWLGATKAAAGDERELTLFVPQSLMGRPVDTALLEQLPAAVVQTFPLLSRSEWAPGLRAPGTGAIRLVTPRGRLLPPGEPVRAPTVRILPIEPGRARLRLRSGFLDVVVLAATLESGAAGEGAGTARVALSRGLPSELALFQASPPQPESEAVVLQLQGPTSDLPATVELRSYGAQGQHLDLQSGVGLVSADCSGEARADLGCASTPAFRLVMDTVDRAHPAVRQRALLAEVGGRIALTGKGGEIGSWRVGAPAALPSDRYRMRIRTTVLRMSAGGDPAVGEDEHDARRIVQSELSAAVRVWGQCGFSVEPVEGAAIRVVDPPPTTLVEVGCLGGTRASGGSLQLRVGGRTLQMQTQRGELPRALVIRLVSRLESWGLRPRVDRNPRMISAAGPSFDLRVADRTGRWLPLDWDRVGSSESTLRICPGEVDLADGLDHFGDANAAAGTLEERALIRAFSDDDPTTIDLLVVPLFSGVGRIGESFLRSELGSIENALIVDRAGIRAGARSLTLAHELGHVLLQMPGHPDDFGVDTPTSLMDADAADATIFGPRRLSLEDCLRAVRQTGPGTPVVLLEEWPLPR